MKVISELIQYFVSRGVLSHTQLEFLRKHGYPCDDVIYNDDDFVEVTPDDEEASSGTLVDQRKLQDSVSRRQFVGSIRQIILPSPAFMIIPYLMQS